MAWGCGTIPGPFVPEATDLYDPAQNSWTRLPPDPFGGDHLLSAWTGAALFSFDSSGIYGPVRLGDASAYDPATGRWTRLPRAPVGCGADQPPIWTGREVLIYCPNFGSGTDAGYSGLALIPARRSSLAARSDGSAERQRPVAGA